MHSKMMQALAQASSQEAASHLCNSLTGGSAAAAADGLVIMFGQQPTEAKPIGACPSRSCRGVFAAAAGSTLRLQIAIRTEGIC